jgi:NADH-quinone oxidoreductase subunit H
VTLFFGGPNGPGLGFLAANGWFNAWIMPVFWFMLKVILLLFGTVWLRASLPRLRYDQLMGLGWKYLIEIAFLWVMISAVVVIGKEEGWSMWIVVPATIAGAAVVGGVLYASVPKRNEVLEEIR